MENVRTDSWFPLSIRTGGRLNEIESNQAMYKAAGHDPTWTIGSVTHTKSD